MTNRTPERRQSCGNCETSGESGWAARSVKFLFDDMDDENGKPGSVEYDCPAWLSNDGCFRLKGYLFHSWELLKGFNGYCSQQGTLVEYERWDADHETFLSNAVQVCFSDVANAGGLSPRFAASYAASVPSSARLLRENVQQDCRVWNFIRSSGRETGTNKEGLVAPGTSVEWRLNKDAETAPMRSASTVIPDSMRKNVPVRADYRDDGWDTEGSLDVSISDDVFKADIVLIAAIAGDRFGIGQIMIIDDDTDGDVLVDSYEEAVGLDRFAADDVFADANSNGTPDVEDAIAYARPSPESSDTLPDTIGSGSSDIERAGTAPDAEPERSVGGGGAAGYTFLLLLVSLVMNRRCAAPRLSSVLEPPGEPR